LLGFSAFRKAKSFHHTFIIYDPVRGISLSDHLQIHTLDLPRWLEQDHEDEVGDRLQSWMRFFTEASGWIEVPQEINHPSLETAMSVLKKFKSNAKWNSAYRMRMRGRALRATVEEEIASQAGVIEAQVAQLKQQHVLLAEQNARLQQQDVELAEQNARLEQQSVQLEQQARFLEERK